MVLLFFYMEASDETLVRDFRHFQCLILFFLKESFVFMLFKN